MTEPVRPADPVLVVDFGAQYAQLIARRVREAHVYSEIVPHSLSAAEIAERSPRGIVLSGGPASVHVEGAPSIDPGVYELGVPILGICYGAQLLARDLGGEVARTGRGEYGRTDLDVVDQQVLFGPAQPSHQPVWMSHFDTITAPPAGATVTASTPDTPAAAFEDVDAKVYGVQFHPEVVHTPHGQEVLEHFLYDACGLAPGWTMTSIIETQVAAIRAQVGDGRAICGLSGGVDSAVAAALVHKAIGGQLTCVFVDTGLMRQGEGEQVVETFRRHQGIELIHVRAGDRFFEKLAGVTDPEDKRKAIGELFIRVFEDAAGGLSDAKYLVQGTLYPDVIESGTKDAAKIKSHHNVGGLPDDMDFELVEPLRALFKDEVRKVGTELGLPDEIVWRQPFPGPGLGVRIIGEVTPEKVAMLQRADAIVREEVKSAGLEREIWQAFAVLPDIRSVGVMGDERTYGHPIIIRAVTSEDAMTADWARLPYELLETMSGRIINEVAGINRVAYDVTSKPPGTIEWE
ncbi:glutamine-hydrolyzing GMP synthase [Rhabdothermincola salaria]|uniref:glutamine-hydrolyzing GMP synthase n=1 Tax=Rhabdothermincola salaria TaxID=2903142 RepID=UPI001E5BA8D8|nr:glutamine-hydrolyzing GMP synthase [Rhabdothermincola salaria]MCD9625521.1 glutamine-hydrolyzing GMP synthase [Rhabdothermincola salaria]